MTFRLCILFTLIFIPLSCGAQDKTPPGDKTVQQIQNLTLSKEKHPNLFYDETDRETMNARLHQEPWASWWKELKTHSVRSTPALTWWLLNDETEAQKSRTNLLENPIWRQKPQGYLEPSSHRFADYIVAYDLLASWEGLTPEDHRTIRNKIASEADHYYEILEGGPQGGANYGNQRTLAASALGMAAFTLSEYTDSPNGPSKWLECALREIQRQENLWFFRPGGHFVEGAGYTNYMNVQFAPFAIACERATGAYFFENPRFREWLIFAAYQLMANGELVPWGTCESGMGLGFFSLLSNSRYGQDLAPLFHRAFNLPPNPVPHLYHMHIALARYNDDIPGEPPPASRAFPQSQTVVLRENWGPETTAVWFAGKDGTWPLEHRYKTYSQGDAGHFVLTYQDEVLAADSGYDHWKSRDYFGAEFHNVILIDGEGPAQNTPGELSSVQTEGPVRHATVTIRYQNTTIQRTLALVRNRYVLVFDRIVADTLHQYTWQIRSTSPPEAPGTHLTKRDITWPGLSANAWRSLEPGRTQLTTVVPPFVDLHLDKGRWRPISSKPEFNNQVARASWQAAETTALFALLPNSQENPDLTWQPLESQNLEIHGPGWTDRILVSKNELLITSSDGQVTLP
ncbi:MAG: heparinase II/III family protein [bacterium]|nr:heparinase II/III family protein [bacterium]